MAKDGPEVGKSHVSTRVMGTPGYAAPEYLATGISTFFKILSSYFCILLTFFVLAIANISYK
jgi:hypothetical protein